MSKLTTEQRKNLSKSSFVFPKKAPEHGSYPIPDRSHAQNALARAVQSSSPAIIAAVRAKVKKKFPGMQQGGK
jgi:hypothetical protein